MKVCASLLTFVLGLGGANFAAASELFTLNVSGTLLRVDQDSGSATAVIESLEPGSWSGLSSRPGDDNILYALHNPRPALFDDPRFSRLSRIDLNSGDTTLFPFFESTALGVSEVFSSGLAISPDVPDLGIVVGNDFEIPPQPYIWGVSLVTGEVIQEARPLSGIRRIESITFNADGTLYATNQDGQLATIDQDTAEATVVGDPGLTSFLSGLAFRPGDETLFAVNALRADELVTLDALMGDLVTTVGSLGIPGPEGLAFLPESLTLDCDMNGTTDVDDLECANAADITEALLTKLGLSPGDLDGKDGVTFADFIILASHFAAPFGKYTEGDIDDSGFVDFADFIILAENFGMTPATAAVPEPVSNYLLLVSVLLGIALRRRR